MTRTPIHAGEILKDELEELGISDTELARQIYVPANRISKIIAGKRNVGGLLPQSLKSYDLKIAEQEIGANIYKISALDRDNSPT